MLFFHDESIKVVSRSIVRREDLEAMSPADVPHCLALLEELERRGALRFSVAALARQSLHGEKLASRLRRHFLSPELVSEIVEHCRSKGWIDDSGWIAQRVQKWHAEGRSSYEISARLQRDGLSPSFLPDDREALRSLLRKKKFPYKTKKERELTIRKLSRRGFSYEIIKEFLFN